MARAWCRVWSVLTVFHAPLSAAEQASQSQDSGSILSFEAFTKQYGRVYEGGLTEYHERRSLYETRVAKVLAQNRHPLRRWTAAINAFSDRTTAELSQLRGWRRSGSSAEVHGQEHSEGSPALRQKERPEHQAPMPDTLSWAFLNRPDGQEHSEGSAALGQKERAEHQAPMPDTLSWAFLNATRRHHPQGGCGSCWAIAAAVLLEAHSEIHSAEGKSRTFSAQELVSCVPNPRHCGGTGGCEGATIELAMDWVIKHGLADDVAVPYMARDGECMADKRPEGASLLQIREHASTRSRAMPMQKYGPRGEVASSLPGSKFGMIGWERLPENEYPALLHALQTGPVGISVAGSNWHDYSSGIFDSCSKDTIINHAVLLIGYGKEDGGDGYWLIKNSWGPEWGENGLMRLMRRDGEEEGQWCGVDRQPQLGTACDGEASEVKVCGTCGILYDSVVPHWQGSAQTAMQHARAAEKY